MMKQMTIQKLGNAKGTLTWYNNSGVGKKRSATNILDFESEFEAVPEETTKAAP